MGRFWKAALIGAFGVVASSTIVVAADMPEPPVFEPPPVYGGWYLRGYLGMTNQKFGGMEHGAFESPAYFEWLDEGEFDAGMLFGGGIGYRLNDWFRMDFTGEYRGKTQFHALDRYSENPVPNFDDEEEWGVNDYRAKKSEWLLLANAYLDMGTWHGFTPYVGAGIGASYNTISNFRDSGMNSFPDDPPTVTPTGGFASDGSQWDLAWALHAGMAFKATKNLTIDVGYSFVDLGDGKTGLFTANDGSCTTCTGVTFKDIVSHDVKIGFRWEFGGDDDYYDPAVVKY